ncbi:MAG: VanZ family protein [Peptostreptococcaceae bacterium]|nr:VanZ family protein [Peptostreptococcaceae bacterium]
MSDKRLRIIMPILCILWICLIFFMSSDANSYYKTLTFSETVVSQINGNTDENTEVDIINLSIRKSGHFLEYLVLSVLLLKTSEVYGMKLKQSAGYVLFICLLIAGLDEFYQSFVPGRNPAVLDSLIDFAGACMGMIIYVGVNTKKINNIFFKSD